MSRSLGHLRTTQTHFLRLCAAILRCHRVLPNQQMRKMGDDFAKSEFRQHYPTDKMTDDQLRNFFVEWTKYLNVMVSQAKDRINLQENVQNGSSMKFGQDLDINIVQGMSPEQLEKIAELGENLNILNKDNLAGFENNG